MKKYLKDEIKIQIFELKKLMLKTDLVMRLSVKIAELPDDGVDVLLLVVLLGLL